MCVLLGGDKYVYLIIIGFDFVFLLELLIRFLYCKFLFFLVFNIIIKIIVGFYIDSYFYWRFFK